MGATIACRCQPKTTPEPTTVVWPPRSGVRWLTLVISHGTNFYWTSTSSSQFSHSVRLLSHDHVCTRESPLRRIGCIATVKAFAAPAGILFCSPELPPCSSQHASRISNGLASSGALSYEISFLVLQASSWAGPFGASQGFFVSSRLKNYRSCVHRSCYVRRLCSLR